MGFFGASSSDASRFYRLLVSVLCGSILTSFSSSISERRNAKAAEAAHLKNALATPGAGASTSTAAATGFAVRRHSGAAAAGFPTHASHSSLHPHGHANSHGRGHGHEHPHASSSSARRGPGYAERSLGPRPRAAPRSDAEGASDDADGASDASEGAEGDELIASRGTSPESASDAEGDGDLEADDGPHPQRGVRRHHAQGRAHAYERHAPHAGPGHGARGRLRAGSARGYNAYGLGDAHRYAHATGPSGLASMRGGAGWDVGEEEDAEGEMDGDVDVDAEGEWVEDERERVGGGRRGLLADLDSADGR